MKYISPSNSKAIICSTLQSECNVQWRRFGSKSGGMRNDRGGCELKVGDKVYISKCHNFENGVQNSAAGGASRTFFWVSTPNCDIF